MAEISLESFGGLVASMRPSNIPEGASPRTYDTDFAVGSVTQRPGLQNAYSYAGAGAGPNPAFSAVNTPADSIAWTDPENVLLEDAGYATVTTVAANNLVATLVGVGQSASPYSNWEDIDNMISAGPVPANIAVAPTAPPQPARVVFNGTLPDGATVVGVVVTATAYSDTAATIPTLHMNINGISDRAALLISGTTPTSYTWGTIIDTWGVTWTPELLATGLILNVTAIDGGAFNVVNVYGIEITLYYTLAGSDDLDVTQFTFALPTEASITGISVSIKGYSPELSSISMQMLLGGVPRGTAKVLALPAAPGFIVFGSAGDGWSAGLSSPEVNQTDFGVRIQALGVGTVNLDFIQMTVFTTGASPNFHYIQSFRTLTGIIYNLALDDDGNWWIENVTSNPGVLTMSLATTPGSYGNGTTVYNRAFVANSTLTGQVTGADMPRQYNFEGQWWDRITQVGPGAPPQVSAAEQANDVAEITAYQVTSNVVTLTAANAYVAGEVGTFSGLGVATFLNGQTLNVISANPTTFVVSATTADVGLTADSGLFTPQFVYPIATITQPAAASDPDDPGHFQALLWSTGPGAVNSGNVVTVYYSNASVHHAPDPVLTAAFNAGNPVYVYITTAPFGNGIWQVTSVGQANPPHGSGGPRWYFTYQVPTANYQWYGGPDDAHGLYHVTQATITMSTAVPGLGAGDTIAIADASVPAWDSVWPIVASINSGQFNITQSSITGGTATYSWELVSGVAPAAGQLVTVTGTLNANGVLNVTDALVATTSGGTSGIFTIDGFSPTLTFGTVVEQGQATTAGTQFIIDPGAPDVGSTNVNPILGNSTGGTLSVVGSTAAGTLPIGPGTRQAVVIFITRNGARTRPSPPVTFTVAVGANYVQANQIPIGPPNVVARLMAFTEAGQNGVPGANFYTTTVPTVFTAGGVQYTSSSLLIDDNHTTSAKFTFSDYVLLNSQAIDIYGYNLFNAVEIGNPAWILQYADRTFYGACQNKIQNFLNLSFDGGYLATAGGSFPVPLGWTVDYNIPDPPELRESPVFGNSIYMKNDTGVFQPYIGMMTQSAYKDAYGVSILTSNIDYSVRVTARSPSNAGPGALIVDLVDSNDGNYGNVYGTYSLPIGTLNTTMSTFSGDLTLGLLTVPPGLALRVYGYAVDPDTDVEIDRIEVYPTNQPVLTNQVWVSYPQLPELVDGVTGQLTLASQSQDPAFGGCILHDAIYFQKSHSIIEVEQTGTAEPSGWSTREVSQRVGTCGPNAFDYGDEWNITLDKTGIFGFNGGIPMPISRELQGFETGDGLWDQINWAASQTFWVTNDLRQRRFYVGVAMNTPNFWLPNAPTVTNPSTPNVIILCNYEGVPSYTELEVAPSVHTTMFGDLKATDMRRKWSLWQIPSPYAGVVEDGLFSYATPFICNGIQSGKIYRLMSGTEQPTDDGVVIQSLYTSYGFVGMADGQQKQVGAGQKLATSFMADLQGSGSLQIRAYPNTLGATYPQTNPLNVPLSDNPQNNIERKFEVRGQRIFYEFSQNQGSTQAPGYWELSAMMIMMTAHPWGTFRGVAQ